MFRFKLDLYKLIVLNRKHGLSYVDDSRKNDMIPRVKIPLIYGHNCSHFKVTNLP